MRLYLVASKPTDAVTHGFLPAAARLGLDVTVLTDQPAEHQRAYAEGPAGPRRVEHCDVWDHRTLITTLTALPAGDAIFSNSDHLQSQTALAADYLGLPGKDWRSALRAKHKPLMRRTLADAGIERVAVARITAGEPPGESPEELTYPVVLKPTDGVASEDVVLADGPEQLREFRDDYFRRNPDGRLMAEEYLPGTQRTLETLGDDVTRWTLGGFRTTMSKPPYFAEERLDWEPAPETNPAPEANPADTHARAHVEAALDTLGVSFGAAHTEYVAGPEPRLIEVNDRVIGDHCEFLLAYLTGLPLFELILKVHLGERLPAAPPAPPPGREHAAAAWILAEHPGVLDRVPPAARHQSRGTTLTHWPMRRPGEDITVTGTNRDYLGVICAVGPDPRAVDAALDDLRENLDYRIQETA